MDVAGCGDGLDLFFEGLALQGRSAVFDVGDGAVGVDDDGHGIALASDPLAELGVVDEVYPVEPGALDDGTCAVGVFVCG